MFISFRSLSADSEWEMLLDRREIELKDGATYAFDLANGMSVAWDCQKEAGAAASITFDAARDNIVSLMVKRDGKGATSNVGGNLIVREGFICSAHLIRAVATILYQKNV